MALTETTGVVGTGRSAFTTMLKDVYGPRWEDHVHSEVVIWSLIAKERGKMGGKRTLTAVVDTFPQSAGVALLEDSALPTPRALSAFNPELIARDIYMRLRWTGQVERAARMGDKAAFAKPRMAEIELARKQFDINVARMAYLGYYQILGKVVSDAAGVVTMTSRNGRDSSAADFYNFGAQYFRKNMSLSKVNAAQGVSGNPDANSIVAANEVYITAINNADPTVPTITLSSDANWTAASAVGDFLVPFNSRRGTSSDQSDYAGVNGLTNLIGDTNLYSSVFNQARSSFPTLSGIRITASGNLRPFDEMLVCTLIDRISDDGIGDEPDTLILHRSVRREVFKANKENRRFGTVVSESGMGKLVFAYGDASIPYVADRDCPPGMLYGIKKGFFGWLQNSPMGPIDEVGERYVTDKDAHEIIMHMAGNIFCTVPFSNGALEDVTYDVTAVTVV